MESHINNIPNIDWKGVMISNQPLNWKLFKQIFTNVFLGFQYIWFDDIFLVRLKRWQNQPYCTEIF